MSYILDALRKLEQNRQHGESLTFLTFQGQAPRKRKKHRLWPYLLVVVLMLNAGVIFWWIGPWQSPGKSMNAEPPAVREAKPAIPASAPAPAATDEVQSRVSTEKTIVAPKEIKEQPRSTKRDIIATTRSAVQQPPAPKQAPAAEEASAPFKKPSPAPPVRAEVTPPADGAVQRSSAPKQAPSPKRRPCRSRSLPRSSGPCGGHAAGGCKGAETRRSSGLRCRRPAGVQDIFSLLHRRAPVPCRVDQ